MARSSRSWPAYPRQDQSASASIGSRQSCETDLFLMIRPDQTPPSALEAKVRPGIGRADAGSASAAGDGDAIGRIHDHAHLVPRDNLVVTRVPTGAIADDQIAGDYKD